MRDEQPGALWQGWGAPGAGSGGAARGRPACSAPFPGPGRFLAFTPGMQRLQQIMENKEDGGKAEQNVSGTLKKFGSVAWGKIQERNGLRAKVLRGRGAESRAQRVPQPRSRVVLARGTPGLPGPTAGAGEGTGGPWRVHGWGGCRGVSAGCRRSGGCRGSGRWGWSRAGPRCPLLPAGQGAGSREQG